MNENLHYISLKEYKTLKRQLRGKPCIFIADLDGNDMKDISEFLKNTSIAFKFPIESKHFGGWCDWITDLTWLKSDEYVLIIRNYSSFLKNDMQSKQTVIEIFENHVLSW